MIKLVAVDLDGTLLNTDSRISIKNRKAIRKCLDNEIKVVIASAKPTYFIKKTVTKLGLKNFQIAYSGALIINKDFNPIFELKMDPHICREIIKLGRSWGKGITLGLDDGMLYYEREHPYNKIVKDAGDKIKKVKDLTSEEICSHALMFSISGYENDGFDDFLKERFKDVPIKIMMGSPFSIIINHSNTSKRFALKKILAKYGIMSKEVLAIGDSYTDISMISEAGIGVAMGNSVEELKKAADFIVSDNDSDGVAIAIEKFVFQNKNIINLSSIN